MPTLTAPSVASSATRFKVLEAHARGHLSRTGLHIVRLDGRAFSTYTRGLQAPFDPQFADAMDAAAMEVAHDLGALTTYVASDEISLVLSARGQRSELPFAGATTKLLSLTAAGATARFNERMYARTRRLATFDSRVVSVDSLQDVLEYLRWRQADTYRNAVSMAARSLFSHRRLFGVSTAQARELVEQHNGAPLAETYPARFLAGRCVERQVTRETVTYTHKRSGEPRTVEADRTRWVALVAPAYRNMSVDELTASLRS